MKTNFIDKTIKSTIVLSCAMSCVVVRSRAQFLVGNGWARSERSVGEGGGIAAYRGMSAHPIIGGSV